MQYIIVRTRIDSRTDEIVRNPDGTELVIELPELQYQHGEYRLEWKEVPVDNAITGEI